MYSTTKKQCFTLQGSYNYTGKGAADESYADDKYITYVKNTNGIAISGGGWKLVRSIPARSTRFSATDHLKGKTYEVGSSTKLD